MPALSRASSIALAIVAIVLGIGGFSTALVSAATMAESSNTWPKPSHIDSATTLASMAAEEAA